MIRLALFTLAVFFSLCACRPTPPPADAGAVVSPSADSGSPTAVVVDPAAPTIAAVVADGGSSVVMLETTINVITPVTTPAAPADLTTDAKAKVTATTQTVQSWQNLSGGAAGAGTVSGAVEAAAKKAVAAEATEPVLAPMAP